MRQESAEAGTVHQRQIMSRERAEEEIEQEVGAVENVKKRNRSS